LAFVHTEVLDTTITDNGSKTKEKKGTNWGIPRIQMHGRRGMSLPSSFGLLEAIKLKIR
jgi:hypothetical protein